MSGSVTVRWSGGERSFSSDAEVRIGRDPTCQVTLDNLNVSRIHASLEHDGQGWLLRDRNSAQGVFHDGQAIAELRLSASQTIVLGSPRVGESIELLTDDQATRHRPENTSADGVGTIVPGAARPGGQLRSDAFDSATVVAGESLRLECGGKTYAFTPGRQIVVGRDADADVVSQNPTVSRRHAVISYEDGGWRIEDAGSSGGLYVDGRSCRSQKLAGSTAVWLGDPEAGERLVIVTGGSKTSSTKDRVRRLNRSGSIGLAAALLGVVAIGLALLGPSGGLRGAGGDLDRLARGVVSLETSNGALGSGTIVDAKNGLILTNAHVVAPRAPGQGVASGEFETNLPQDPRGIIVSIADGIDKTAEPRFRAEVVAVDGYLDLAVLKISSTLTGALIESDDLSMLTAIPIGSSDGLRSGDPVRILGYPTVAQSNAATLTEGVVAGIVPDMRLRSNQAFYNLTAQINPGNSGGLASDGRGRIIGVPTLNWVAASSSQVAAMRPIALAEDLLQAARSGTPYESPFVTPLTGSEAVSSVRFGQNMGPGFSNGCEAAGEAPAQGDRALSLMIDYSGMTAGLHQDLWVGVWDDSAGSYIAETTTATDWPFEFAGSGCVAVGIELPQPLGAGEYLLDFLVGPNYQAMDATFSIPIP